MPPFKSSLTPTWAAPKSPGRQVGFMASLGGAPPPLQAFLNQFTSDGEYSLTEAPVCGAAPERKRNGVTHTMYWPNRECGRWIWRASVT